MSHPAAPEWDKTRNEDRAVEPVLGDDDLGRLNQILAYVGRLQSHALRAGSLQEQYLNEIDLRSKLLADSLKAAGSEIDDSTALAANLRETTVSRLQSSLERIGQELRNIAEVLQEKTTQAATVMQDIEAIGKSVKMLSLNATIEANRAGEHGRGFAVVAQEVREFAQKTTQNAKVATETLDLADVNQRIQADLSEIETTLSELMTAVQESLSSLQTRFEQTDGRLTEVQENNAIVFEMLEGSRTASERAQHKAQWAANVMHKAAGGFRGNALDSQAIARILSESHIHARADYDRLEAVQVRGRLRVAIEPSFVGLSFRLKPGDSLRGLDVEYAQAFASWLGVDCEFVEHPWDLLTELLYTGRQPGEEEADIIISALPPSADYEGIAYSETYTWLHYVLCRRHGDDSIKGLGDLDGKVLGIINDPGAFTVLEEAGVRWNENADKPGGKVRLENLIAYSDQSRIHDCLADGIVHAFAVDLPIYYWAATNRESPWKDRIEIIPGNIPQVPYYYTAAVAAEAQSYRLLKAFNAWCGGFLKSSERAAMERHWQGQPVQHRANYRDEPGDLIGEDELKPIHEAHCRRYGLTFQD